MKKQPDQETCRTSSPTAILQILTATFALGAMLVLPAKADNLDPFTGPGGIQVRPTNWFTITTSNAVLNYQGLESPYAIQLTTDGGVTWSNVGLANIKYPNSSGSTVITAPGLYRLMMLGGTNWAGKYNPGALAVSNVFVGAGQCIGCHSDKVTSWGATEHAAAYANATNFALISRAVGSGQPGGFVDLATTPHLANVQCENCHGSANAHTRISNRTYHPVNSLSATVCGSCHTGPLTPTYDEWVTSPHAEVVPDVAYGIGEGAGTVYQDTVTAVLTNATTGLPYSAVLNGYLVTTNGITNVLAGIVNSTNDFAGLGRQMTCGFCHSGATRLAMLNDYDARKTGVTNFLTLPDKWAAAETAQTCAVCHDPHADYNAAQLRNPLTSTNYYSLFTGSSIAVTNRFTNVLGQASMTVSYKADGFADQYNPNIQICAQCHNTRGARWDGKSKSWNVASNAMVLGSSQSFRAPHPTAQYNMLIGVLQDDYLTGTNSPVTHNHSRAPYGCATCHVPIYSAGGTNITGHSFALDTKGCSTSGCHGSVPSEFRSTQSGNSNNVLAVVALLNQWATNAGPALFGANYANYLQNAWEYPTPGALAAITNSGPSAADQLKLPDAIKQARFDIYEVQGDGSWGIHNITYIPRLITDASTKVSSLLIAFTNAAYFTADATTGYAPFTVNFTSYGSGITNYSWTFGDGGTATSANPSYAYNNPGTNTVQLTVMTTNGTATYSRTNYIRAYMQPAINFYANTFIGEAPLTVTFTNTSTSTNSVTAWRWTFNGVNVTATNQITTYTFPTPGSYAVALRATTPVGSLTVTSNSFVIGTTNPAYFVSGAATGYVPFTVAFTNVGIGATGYNWTFGDGGTSTNANPTYVYNTRGTNTVILNVATPGGTKTWARSNYVAAYDRPVVSFSAGPLTGEFPLTVTFTNTSANTNSVTAWRWSFGSATVTPTNPVTTYTFTNGGTYDVQLRATTPVGTITTTNLAYVNAVTNAAFFVTTNATTGYAPLTNTFQVLGSGATSYAWTFGDGGTSTNPNPTYVYTGQGTNTVALTVTTAGGPKTYTRSAYIKTYLLPVVSFAANTLSGPAPLSVTFTNTSSNTNSVTAWRWSFGSVNVTTNAPIYTYVFPITAPTNYTIQLRATTPFSTITTTNVNYITVTP